jgi:hypothetical protein
MLCPVSLTVLEFPTTSIVAEDDSTDVPSISHASLHLKNDSSDDQTCAFREITSTRPKQEVNEIRDKQPEHQSSDDTNDESNKGEPRHEQNRNQTRATAKLKGPHQSRRSLRLSIVQRTT